MYNFQAQRFRQHDVDNYLSEQFVAIPDANKTQKLKVHKTPGVIF